MDTSRLSILTIYLGVKNMRALNKVIQQQVLGYAYPFHEFDLSTDLGFIVLSRAKSMFPVSLCSMLKYGFWDHLTFNFDVVSLRRPTFPVGRHTAAGFR
jgi:hypothetical protein